LKANKIVITVGGIIALTIFLSLDIQQYLTLAALKSNRQNLEDFYAAHKLTILVSFMVVYIFQTVLLLPGAAILSLAAGAIFGTAIGVICVIIAATLGAVLAFLATRYMFRDAVMKRFGSRLEGINKELEDRGFNYLLFLRLVPLFPFFLINLAAGLTRLPLRTFIIGTMLGIIPGGFVYVNAGANLASVDSLSGIASPNVMISLSLLGLFVLLPVLYNNIRTRKCSP
jgi:uncharacterized membrane protein YdjX (TVP38/TMEM64 family)